VIRPSLRRCLAFAVVRHLGLLGSGAASRRSPRWGEYARPEAGWEGGCLPAAGSFEARRNPGRYLVLAPLPPPPLRFGAGTFPPPGGPTHLAPRKGPCYFGATQ